MTEKKYNFNTSFFGGAPAPKRKIMKIVEQLSTIPLSNCEIDFSECDIILKLNDDNIFYSCPKNIIAQVDGIDVWRWKIDKIDIAELQNFLGKKIEQYEPDWQDFEPCQWFTDEYY